MVATTGIAKDCANIGDSANPLLIVSAAGVRQREVDISAKQISTALNVRSRGFRKNRRERQNEVLAFAHNPRHRRVQEGILLCTRGVVLDVKS